MGLAVRALNDFRYQQLSMTLAKGYDGEGTVGIRLEGANPAVLEGYPFVFNITLSSNFDRLNRLLEESLGAADRVLKMGIEGLGPGR